MDRDKLDPTTVKAARILELENGQFESLIHLSDGSTRLIVSNTLEGVLEKTKECQLTL